MQVINRADHVVDDATCKADTGKTLSEWFTVLDAFEGLKKGRRESIWHIMEVSKLKDVWWPTTIYVEYERHHGIVKKDGLGEGYTICVTKTISAPVDKTFAIWTNPQKFSEFFGDNGKQDLQEGGSIACAGGCKGTFTRIRPDKDLRFTWEHPGSVAPMTVDVQFQDVKGKTLMNAMTSRIQTRDEADGLRNSWAEALSRLKVLAEA